MTRWKDKNVLVVGGSSGLGAAIARAFHAAGAQVAIAARDQSKLNAMAAEIGSDGPPLTAWPVDIQNDDSVVALKDKIESEWQRLDVLVNVAGKSDRGRVEDTSIDKFRELLELNALGTLRCTKTFLPMLLAARGNIVNIGSLASKAASANLGAYCFSKFPVAALSQQLRLEYGERLHVLLVCPGPIRRDDAGTRYQAENVPEKALQPGGGVNLKGIDSDWLARKVVRACEQRKPELVVPFKARLLFAVSALFPRIGDWIVRRMTS